MIAALSTGECPACSCELIAVLGMVAARMSTSPPPFRTADVTVGYPDLKLCECANCGNLFAHDENGLLTVLESDASIDSADTGAQG